MHDIFMADFYATPIIADTPPITPRR